MRVFLTGGSGDLGHVLSGQFELRGDVPVRFDVRPPLSSCGLYVKGSILDRETLQQSLAGMDCVVHIAAWHGIHEVTGAKDVYDFWDLNVTGTFYVFEAAVRAGVQRVVYISSTSIGNWASVYGHTKVLGEEVARVYAQRHRVNVITLRPRAFIPSWNRAVYPSYVEWAKWFWRGAVHIEDVSQAVVRAVDLLGRSLLSGPLVLTVDGAYEYTDDDLRNWDKDGPGTTFRKYYADYYDLAVRYGLDPGCKPEKLAIAETRQRLGYDPRYSLKNLLVELDRFGEAGPPVPVF
ncbi:MAG TPA: NAD(P)-dependent oxidoreductase [Gemmataceae bacterium]|nr:NAD(P)-dependent oxidoreductase [Gemmataceae bacterium]